MNPIASWFERRRVDREMQDEMAAHLAEKIDDLVTAGHSAQDARRLARQQMGNLTLHREDSRATWGWNNAEQVMRDIKFSLRVLAKTPVFTATVVLILALAIGLNTTIFSAVEAVLLSALPYPDPARIVQLWQTNKSGGKMNASGPDFRD